MFHNFLFSRPQNEMDFYDVKGAVREFREAGVRILPEEESFANTVALQINRQVRKRAERMYRISEGPNPRKLTRRFRLREQLLERGTYALN